tara:strand:- start:177 stop:353 length:177 start_codon:yes stop_codon:yes gene_type:complete
VPTKGKELSINKGIELMLRRAKEDVEKKPSKGFGIQKEFSLLKRKFYFNFELRWVKNK